MYLIAYIYIFILFTPCAKAINKREKSIKYIRTLTEIVVTISNFGKDLLTSALFNSVF